MENKIEQLFNQGVQLRRDGKSEEALQLLRQVTQADPAHARAWIAMAYISSDYLEVGEAIERARKFDSHHPLLDKAQSRFESMLPASAKEDISSMPLAIEPSPPAPPPIPEFIRQLQQAAELRQAQNMAGALAIFRQVSREHPRHPTAWWGMAMSSSNHTECLGALETIAYLDPYDVHAPIARAEKLYEMANAYQQQPDLLKQAETIYKQIIDDYPKSELAYQARIQLSDIEHEELNLLPMALPPASNALASGKSLPSPITKLESEGEKPLPVGLLLTAWGAFLATFGLPLLGDIGLIMGFAVFFVALGCGIALVRHERTAAKVNGWIILAILFIQFVIGFLIGFASAF